LETTALVSEGALDGIVGLL